MSFLHLALLLVGLGGVLFSLLYRDPEFRETTRYSLQGAALLPIFYLAVRFNDNALFKYLNTTWINRLGVYSYFIYLIHYIFIKLLTAHIAILAGKPYAIFPVVLALSIAYAAAIDRFVDPYFRKLEFGSRAEDKDGSYSPTIAGEAKS